MFCSLSPWKTEEIVGSGSLGAGVVPMSWDLTGIILESNKHLTTEPPGIFFLNIEFFLKPIL